MRDSNSRLTRFKRAASTIGLIEHRYRRRDSNPHSTRSKRVRSPLAYVGMVRAKGFEPSLDGLSNHFIYRWDTHAIGTETGNRTLHLTRCKLVAVTS